MNMHKMHDINDWNTYQILAYKSCMLCLLHSAHFEIILKSNKADSKKKK